MRTTLEEKIKGVKKIKDENRLVKNRIAALKAAGYEYAEMNPRDMDEEKYHYVYFHCSTDWNRTFGYALIAKQ